MASVESAVAQPRATFDERDLYPTLVEKAAALGFFLIQGHPLVDGNKRVGHAAMEIMLVLNGHEIDASTNEQEAAILRVASGQMDREQWTAWLSQHIKQRV